MKKIVEGFIESMAWYFRRPATTYLVMHVDSNITITTKSVVTKPFLVSCWLCFSDLGLSQIG